MHNNDDNPTHTKRGKVESIPHNPINIYLFSNNRVHNINNVNNVNNRDININNMNVNNVNNINNIIDVSNEDKMIIETINQQRCSDGTRFSLETYVNGMIQLIEEKKNTQILEAIDYRIPGDMTSLVLNSGKDNKTLIQLALITKNMPLVRKLINRGANLYAIPPGGNSTFHLAICDSNILVEIIKIVKDLIAEGKPIPIECGKVVYYAIYSQKFEGLKILLDQDSPFLQFVNIDILNATPLHIALKKGDFEAVKILIKAGADVNKCSKEGHFPIHFAAYKGDFNCFCYLIQFFNLQIKNQITNFNEYKNLDEYLTLRTKDTKMTPYHFASFRGNWRVLDYMLRLSSTALNYRSALGMAAIHYGVSEAHDSVVATLLPHKPNIFLEDKDGKNSIVYAGFKNRYHCGVLLINHINQYKFELANNGELKRDLLLYKKMWLALSVFDTSKFTEVSVTFKPNFEQLMGDIDLIRAELVSTAINVESKVIKWKKYQLLHLKYRGKYDIKSKGILREYLSNAAEVLLGSDLFYPIGGGRTFGLTYHEKLDSETLENMRRIGFFLALAILTNPVHFPLEKYIIKVVAGELVAPSDFLGESILDHLQMIEAISPALKVSLDLPNSTVVHTSQFNVKEIVFSDEFVTEETFSEYKNNVIYTHIYGGGRRELLAALSEGFYSLLPRHFLKVENENNFMAKLYQPNLVTSEELQQLLLRELPFNIEDWKPFTL